jgi:ABC-type glycerol-3-phosphate transport system permease component
MRTPVTAHSVADPSPMSKMVASLLVVTYAVVTILPLLWIFLTGFKTPPDSIAYPPKILFEPSVEGTSTCSQRARGRRRNFWPACRRRRPGMSAWCAPATW